MNTPLLYDTNISQTGGAVDHSRDIKILNTPEYSLVAGPYDFRRENA